MARKADNDELPDSSRLQLEKIWSNNIKSCCSFVKRSVRSRKRQRSAVDNRRKKIAIEVAPEHDAGLPVQATLKSLSGFPVISCSLSQRGRLPRPLQVSNGRMGF
jgi:hypothetical protein